MDCAYNPHRKTFEYTCGVYIPKKAMYALLKSTYDTQEHFDASLEKFKEKMNHIRQNDLFCSCSDYSFYKNQEFESHMQIREITKFFISLKYCVHSLVSRADRAHRFFIRIVSYSLLPRSLTFNPIDILLRYESQLECDLVENRLVHTLRSHLDRLSKMNTLEDFGLFRTERWANILFSKRPHIYDLKFEKRVECIKYESKMIYSKYAKLPNENEICIFFCDVCEKTTERIMKSTIRMCVSCRTARILDLLYVKYISYITLYDIMLHNL